MDEDEILWKWCLRQQNPTISFFRCSNIAMAALKGLKSNSAPSLHKKQESWRLGVWSRCSHVSHFCLFFHFFSNPPSSVPWTKLGKEWAIWTANSPYSAISDLWNTWVTGCLSFCAGAQDRQQMKCAAIACPKKQQTLQLQPFFAPNWTKFSTFAWTKKKNNCWYILFAMCLGLDLCSVTVYNNDRPHASCTRCSPTHSSSTSKRVQWQRHPLLPGPKTNWPFHLFNFILNIVWIGIETVCKSWTKCICHGFKKSSKEQQRGNFCPRSPIVFFWIKLNLKHLAPFVPCDV